MPMLGRKPLPEGISRNRAPLQHEWVEIPNVPYTGPAPRLWSKRTVRGEDIRPHPMTKRWWRVISRMPHCTLWSEADWDFALATSLVADSFFYGNTSNSTELRNREKLLGNTYDSRRDLRIRYVEPKPVEDAPEVTSLDDYRAL